MEELQEKNKGLKALYKETHGELNVLENSLEGVLETANVMSARELWFDWRESSISGVWGRGVLRYVFANIEISYDGH
jgi:hypothetical protein